MINKKFTIKKRTKNNRKRTKNNRKRTKNNRKRTKKYIGNGKKDIIKTLVKPINSHLPKKIPYLSDLLENDDKIKQNNQYKFNIQQPQRIIPDYSIIQKSNMNFFNNQQKYNAPSVMQQIMSRPEVPSETPIKKILRESSEPINTANLFEKTLQNLPNTKQIENMYRIKKELEEKTRDFSPEDKSKINFLLKKLENMPILNKVKSLINETSNTVSSLSSTVINASSSLSTRTFNMGTNIVSYLVNTILFIATQTKNSPDISKVYFNLLYSPEWREGLQKFIMFCNASPKDVNSKEYDEYWKINLKAFEISLFKLLEGPIKFILIDETHKNCKNVLSELLKNVINEDITNEITQNINPEISNNFFESCDKLVPIVVKQFSENGFSEGLGEEANTIIKNFCKETFFITLNIMYKTIETEYEEIIRNTQQHFENKSGKEVFFEAFYNYTSSIESEYYEEIAEKISDDIETNLESENNLELGNEIVRLFLKELDEKQEIERIINEKIEGKISINDFVEHYIVSTKNLFLVLNQNVIESNKIHGNYSQSECVLKALNLSIDVLLDNLCALQIPEACNETFKNIAKILIPRLKGKIKMKDVKESLKIIMFNAIKSSIAEKFENYNNVEVSFLIVLLFRFFRFFRFITKYFGNRWLNYFYNNILKRNRCFFINLFKIR